jgi:hypothetical protein
MKTFHAKSVSYSEYSEDVEYFQVLFEESENSETGYVLLQRQFEFPDRGWVYFECDEFDRSGHFSIRQSRLCRESFEIRIPGRPGGYWKIFFEISDRQFEELKMVLVVILSSPNHFMIKDQG